MEDARPLDQIADRLRNEADAYRFEVSCTLGGRPMALEFSTWL